MAHAAKTTLVTVEEIFDGDLMADPLRAPATIPALYITKFARVENGAWPLGLEGSYDVDKQSLSAYAKAAKTSPEFEEYLDIVVT